MPFAERAITGPGGRRLLVRDAATPPGSPCWSTTPGSRVVRRRWVRAAEERGVRLVLWERGGYGCSDRAAGRVIADVAADALAIADALQLDRVVTLGSSGGGPHALACAALLSERVSAAALFASAAPSNAPDLDFLAGMGEDNLRELRAAREGADALVPVLEEFAADILAGGTEQLVESLRSLLTPPDVEVVSTELAEDLLDGMRTGIADTRVGWVDDDLALVSPWGFAVESVSTPVQLWQGRLDLMVPPAHGKRLAERLPNADVHLCDDEGHLSIGQAKIAETLGWLKERAG